MLFERTSSSLVELDEESESEDEEDVSESDDDDDDDDGDDDDDELSSSEDESSCRFRFLCKGITRKTPILAMETRDDECVYVDDNEQVS